MTASSKASTARLLARGNVEDVRQEEQAERAEKEGRENRVPASEK
jgi:hypothetical protein